MIIHRNIEQGSPEWFAVKLGKPSTSNFHRMMSNKVGTTYMGDTAKTYALELALERITGEITKIPMTEWMKRGIKLEPEARQHYMDNTFRNVEEIGGIENFGCYCSTDGLVVDKLNDRLVEIKCHKGTIHYKHLMKPTTFLNHHKWQLQGELWISERRVVDLYGYHPKFTENTMAIEMEVERNEEMIGALQIRKKKFLTLVDKIEKSIKDKENGK